MPDVSFTTARGPPPHDPAKYDGDQKCPRVIARLILPVNSCRNRRAETPLRLGQPGDSNRRRVVREKVRMVTLGVELRQLRAEVRAHVPHDLLAPP